MSGAAVEVVGARQLRRTMKQAGVDMGRMKDAHARVGNIVVGAARTSAPTRSGALAGSIRAGRGTTSAIVRAGKASVPYAGVIHWGWPGHNIAANPFLTAAATSTEPAWSAAYLEAVDGILATIQGA